MDLGIEVTDVHCIIKFSQSLWLSRYIEFTTVKCTNAMTKFEKDLFKLRNNAVYHHDVKIKQIYESLQKHIKNPVLFNVKDIADNILLENKKLDVLLNKPIYVGFCILERSTFLMYDFHYKFAKIKLPGVCLCYMDTDSFIYSLFMSFLQYGITVWGQTYESYKEPIFKLQKKPSGSYQTRHLVPIPCPYLKIYTYLDYQTFSNSHS